MPYKLYFFLQNQFKKYLILHFRNLESAFFTSYFKSHFKTQKRSQF